MTHVSSSPAWSWPLGQDDLAHKENWAGTPSSLPGELEAVHRVLYAFRGCPSLRDSLDLTL